MAKNSTKTRLEAHKESGVMLCEVAWEVCNQLGGIYTVIRSKAPTMTQLWSRRYLLVGPYEPDVSPAEFEELTPPAGPIASAIQTLAGLGIGARFGRWLVTGQPQVVLLDHRGARGRLAEIKYLLWQHHGISTPAGDELLDGVVAFGHVVEHFFRALLAAPQRKGPVIAHFHEWMAAAAVPELRWARLPVAIVFTTHATILGRWLATNDPGYHDRPRPDWYAEARRLNILPQASLERAAAHGAHVFTTVSDVMAEECSALLGRRPDLLLPNGLNIERFAVLHEFQNLHREHKDKIHRFVIGHFFPAYSFDLDHTLYFFSSGRLEHHNKGFDLTIDALAQLRDRLKAAGSDRTVVFFLLTRRPFRSINAEALHTQAQMEEIHRTCRGAGEQVAERLFLATVQGRTPSLEELVDEYWRMRLRRFRQAWRVRRLPTIVTHDLIDDVRDEVLSHLRRVDLINRPEDPVKVIYHPDFLTATTPLLDLDYDQFVRGCHLGIFPSFYEPWGYTPEECAARGVPSVTTDLSGFGSYVTANIPDHAERGLFVVHRRNRPYGQVVEELTACLWSFAQLGRRARIDLRNRVEVVSEQFDWGNLIGHYEAAHQLALDRTGAGARAATDGGG